MQISNNQYKFTQIDILKFDQQNLNESLLVVPSKYNHYNTEIKIKTI